MMRFAGFGAAPALVRSQSRIGPAGRHDKQSQVDHDACDNQQVSGYKQGYCKEMYQQIRGVLVRGRSYSPGP